MQELLDDGFGQLNGLPAKTYLATLEQMRPPSLLKSPEDTTLASAARFRDGARPSRDRVTTSRQEADTSTWQIRLGEFTQEQAAEQQLSIARRLTPGTFRRARVAISAHHRRGKTLYVAYLKGISKDEADRACQVLKRRGVECALTPFSS
jgi:hypothetical protein